MEMPCEKLWFFVYFAAQKVSQLYRQLPEARVVMQKQSCNSNGRGSYDFAPQPGNEEQDCLRMTHICQDRSDSRYREAVFDKNEMYQLQQVLRRLRRSGQLCPLPQADCCCPGMFYELRGGFTRSEPEGASHVLALRAPARGSCPALLIYCEKFAFWGENKDTAWQEVWRCGEPLGLHGVMLCLRVEDGLVTGLPLYLSAEK
ncbi:MAG: hypothetical protein FWH26_09855 [Oscillospiraceae bacterium]|nr:hypothetical protein [Oscillospiraceae bacterium]